MNLNLRILSAFLSLFIIAAEIWHCRPPSRLRSPLSKGFWLRHCAAAVRPSVRHLLGNERRRGGGEHADQTAHGRRSMPMRNAVILVVWRENSSDDLGVVFYHVR